MKKILFLLSCLMLSASPFLLGNDGVEIDSGATAWMLTSTALVLLMVARVGYVLWRACAHEKCTGHHDA